jgi:hypothetical protein
MKPGDIIVSRTNGKHYNVTRVCKTHIWIRGVAYGEAYDVRRGLSLRLTREFVEENFYHAKTRD